MRGQRNAQARRSRSGCVRRGPHAPPLGARARFQARNAQRDFVVAQAAPREGRTELEAYAGWRWAAGARNRGWDSAVRCS